MIYNVEIRSIGHLELEQVDPIDLFSISILKMSFLGLLIPIVLLSYLGKFKSILFNERLNHFIVFSVLYGVMIYFIRNNPFLGIGGDLLVCFGLFTGLSLGALLPKTQKSIAIGLTFTSAVPTFIATVLLISLPDVDLFQSFVRTTHPSAFILLGLPITLTAPSMIYSILHRNVKLIAISWLSAGVLLVISISILQTRSQAIAVAFSIIISVFTCFIPSYYLNKRLKIRKPSKIAWKAIVTIIIFVLTTLYISKGNLSHFYLRMGNIYTYQEDSGIAPRLEEVPLVFGSMNLFDHISGMGLNPVSLLFDWRGYPYNTIHAGILNIWWRFGFPIFLAVIYLFGRLLIKYIYSLKYLCIESLWNKVNNETIATIICAPGVITVFIISCMSGGWGISTTISLGILWEFYRTIANNRNNYFNIYNYQRSL
jgi:hypothetical protein